MQIFNHRVGPHKPHCSQVTFVNIKEQRYTQLMWALSENSRSKCFFAANRVVFCFLLVCGCQKRKRSNWKMNLSAAGFVFPTAILWSRLKCVCGCFGVSEWVRECRRQTGNDETDLNKVTIFFLLLLGIQIFHRFVMSAGVWPILRLLHSKWFRKIAYLFTSAKKAIYKSCISIDLFFLFFVTKINGHLHHPKILLVFIQKYDVDVMIIIDFCCCWMDSQKYIEHNLN